MRTGYKKGCHITYAYGLEHRTQAWEVGDAGAEGVDGGLEEGEGGAERGDAVAVAGGRGRVGMGHVWRRI